MDRKKDIGSHKKEADGGRTAGKKNGRVALAAGRRMAETAATVFAFLENRDSTTGASVLVEMEEKAYVVLAQVTKNPGGGKLLVQLRDGTVPDPVRICKPLQVKGRAAPKQFSNIMHVGDVVVIVKGDIEGKLTPAQGRRVQASFDKLGISYPTGFFAAEDADSDEEEGAGYMFDRTAEAEAEERADEARQLEEARAWAIHNGTEVPLTVPDIARVKADYDAKRLAVAAAAAQVANRTKVKTKADDRFELYGAEEEAEGGGDLRRTGKKAGAGDEELDLSAI